jgi:hypothetical protein
VCLFPTVAFLSESTFLSVGASTTVSLQEQVQALKDRVDEQEVTLREQQTKLEDQEFWAGLLAQVLQYTDDNLTAVSTPEFKWRLMKQYSRCNLQSANGPLAYCMLTHKYLPREMVIASHLWKRAWAK